MTDARTALFPTTLVGSMPQPDWLIDREKLAGRFPPRVRARELWRIAPAVPAGGAGRCDGPRHPSAGGRRPRHRHGRRDPPRELLEPVRERARRRRPRQPRHGAGSLRPSGSGAARDGPIRRRHAVERRDVEFLRAHTTRRIKVTVPGPFTMSQQAQIDHYGGSRSCVGGLRRRAQCRDPRPVLRRRRHRPDRRALHAGAAGRARQYGLEALNRALDGVTGTTAVHICFGYAAVIHARPAAYSFLPELARLQLPAGLARDRTVRTRLLDPRDTRGQEDHARRARPRKPEVETPEAVAARIRRALPFVRAEDVIVAPDCGLKYLGRDVAFGKLKAMVAGAAMLRTEMARAPGTVRLQSNS